MGYEDNEYVVSAVEDMMADYDYASTQAISLNY